MKKTTKPTRQKKQPAAAIRDPAAAAAAFPIVGIGASAGGLEALELFLKNVPAGSGMAFVIVQHLDPTHKGIMAELLQRATPMKVAQVKDRTRVQPDCVYVIPPNKDLSILHGVLHLLDPVAPRGLRLPIDFFLRSLAEDAEEHSIGVILSGMGSDGTLGLKAIKGVAGAVFVQDPASAKFDGMPRSAMESGLADIVAPVEALPGRIIAYLKHIPIIADPELAKEDKSQNSFEKITILLRSQTGHDFSLYKKNTVYRRIERRMGIHQIAKITSYVRFLQENPQEAELLFKELLIGVTSFFRDPAAWEQLKTGIIPALLKDRPPTQPLRVWVPACATGEEAYSLAILFKEALEKLKPGHKPTLQIFATDLDKDAIEKARAAVYPLNIAADVSPERLSRFFVKAERGYQVSKPIRETIIFALQNVIMDAPFTKVDLVSCRNLLIYLMPELQKSLLSLFHYSLNPGGVLFLGNAESIAGDAGPFAPLAGKARLYRRLDSGPQAVPVEFPASFTFARTGTPLSPASKPPANLQAQAEQLLLQRYSPAAVLVNPQGDILFISGRTGKYLEPAAGKANWNLFAMVREGLSCVLSNAFRQALRQKDAVTRPNVKVGTNGGVQTVDLTVQAITEPKALRGLVMVVFTDVATPPAMAEPAKGAPASQARFVALKRDLAQANQELQSTREEMQTFQEEAKSANEEMQSTNEELQSTNEELTTSKEEMQSMNEELQTLNAELQHKVGGLSQLNNDQKNLLDNTEIGIVFLDTALRVRLFTAGSNRFFKLIPGDVGRPITDIASELDCTALADNAREVLRTLTAHEQSVAVHDGRRFHVRIMPYRTLENMIDGVVITFVDVTETKRATAALRESEERFKQLFVEAPLGIALIDSLTGRIHEVNPMFAKIAGRTQEEMLHIDWMSITHPEDVQEDLANMARLNAGKIDGFQMEQRYLHRDGTAVWINMTIAPVKVEDQAHPRHLCMIEDITKGKREQAALRESEEKYRTLANNLPSGMVVHGPDTSILFSNAAASSLLGLTEDQLLGKTAMDPCWRFLHEDGSPMPLGDYPANRVFTSGKGFHSQVVGVSRPDRTESVWLLVNAYPVKNEKGQIVQAVITFTDITERKQAEEALAKTNDLLRLAVVVRDAHDAITVQDLEGRIIAWNPGAVRMYGWSEAEALAMNVRDRIPKGLREDALATLVQLGKAEILEPYRTQRLAKDGTVKEVSIISTALVNEAGQMYAIATTERGGGQ